MRFLKSTSSFDVPCPSCCRITIMSRSSSSSSSPLCSISCSLFWNRHSRSSLRSLPFSSSLRLFLARSRCASCHRSSMAWSLCCFSSFSWASLLQGSRSASGSFRFAGPELFCSDGGSSKETCFVGAMHTWGFSALSPHAVGLCCCQTTEGWNRFLVADNVHR